MSVKFIKIGFILILVALIIVTYFSPVHRWADGSTYFMQIDSISHDLDIRYEQKDIERIFQNRFDDLPAGLWLMKNDNGDLFYAKEFTYALVASPFYTLLGKNGILVFNSVMFFLMIYMGYLYLRHRNSSKISFLISTLFFVLSTTFVYIFWIHTEIYNMFLITLGFFLWFNYLYQIDNSSGNRALIYLSLSALVLGFAAYAKTPSTVCILPLLLCEAYFRRCKNFILVSGLFIIMVLLLYGTFYAMTGSATPYTFQYYFVDKYPFLEGSDSNCSILATPIIGELIKSSILSLAGFQKISYNIFYYLFGRFAGIFWYYPSILLGIICWFGFLGRKTHSNTDLGCLLMLLPIILYIFEYIFLDYDNLFINYFGGGHAVGNRLFYIYPAFLFLINKIEFNKKTIITILLVLSISFIFVAPIISHPIETSISPMEHTTHMPFKALPLEYTELNNLPLWSPPVAIINNTTFYFTQSNIEVYDNSLIIDGPYPELLFKSTPITTYRIHLLNSQESKHIVLKSGEFKKEIILNASQGELIDLPAEPIFKINNKEYLYKLDISILPEFLSDNKLVFNLIGKSD